MSNFPYESISEFFEVEGDFEENIDPAAEAAAFYAEAEMAQWDDDPNPYHGDYSEM